MSAQIKSQERTKENSFDEGPLICSLGFSRKVDQRRDWDSDQTCPNSRKWFSFNDAEVKVFDPSHIAAECFGGEMNSRTYDQVV